MYLSQSSISCGIHELEEVGDDPTEEVYKEAVRVYSGYYPIEKTFTAMIIASLTVYQKKGIKFLKKMKFKQVGKAIKNPNSKNKILLFIKQFPRKSKKKSSKRKGR